MIDNVIIKQHTVIHPFELDHRMTDGRTDKPRPKPPSAGNKSDHHEQSLICQTLKLMKHAVVSQMYLKFKISEVHNCYSNKVGFEQEGSMVRGNTGELTSWSQHKRTLKAKSFEISKKSFHQNQ